MVRGVGGEDREVGYGSVCLEGFWTPGTLTSYPVSCSFLAACLTPDPVPSPGCPVVSMLMDGWREGVRVDSRLVEQGGSGKVWERVFAGLFVSVHVHKLSGLLLFLAAGLT